MSNRRLTVNEWAVCMIFIFFLVSCPFSIYLCSFQTENTVENKRFCFVWLQLFSVNLLSLYSQTWISISPPRTGISWRFKKLSCFYRPILFLQSDFFVVILIQIILPQHNNYNRDVTLTLINLFSQSVVFPEHKPQIPSDIVTGFYCIVQYITHHFSVPPFYFSWHYENFM